MNTANIEAQFLARTGQRDDAEAKALDKLGNAALSLSSPGQEADGGRTDAPAGGFRTPICAIGPRGFHVDHRGQPVEWTPPRANVMPPSMADAEFHDPAIAALNRNIERLGTDANGGQGCPPSVPLVAIGPPGYEHDGAWKAPSLSPVLDAVERAKAKPVTADDLVNRVIAEARKVCRDFAEVEASGADNETKHALFQGVAGLQGALAALDRKRG